MVQQATWVWQDIKPSRETKERQSRQLIDVDAFRRLLKRGLGPNSKGYDARPRDAK